jgi:hypothetical protein
MRPTPSGHLGAASLIAWLLLLPPFSITSAGKTFVDAQAALSRWEVLSRHDSDSQCLKHRDQLRAELDRAAASNVDSPGESANQTPEKAAAKATGKRKEVFAALKHRVAAARCIASNDARLAAPVPSPTK